MSDLRYDRAPCYVLVQDSVRGALYPAPLRYAVDMTGITYTVEAPLQGETVVAMAHRIYHDASAYWLLAAVNGIIDPFAVVTEAIKAPNAAGLAALVGQIKKGASVK